MLDSKKTENLKNVTLIELKDMLHRENELLKNKKLIHNLPDKGESIKKFRDKVEMELMFRKELMSIEDSMSKMSIEGNEKHTQKLYDIEKTPKKERFKPFATLNKVQEVKADSKIFKIMEDCTQCNKPTKLISLPESMHILKNQDERVKEEQIRVRHTRILNKLQDNDEENKNESDSEYENCEHYSDCEEHGDDD